MTQLAIGLVDPVHQFFTNTGAVNANGYIITYAAGTTTLQSTYSDSALTAANANNATPASSLQLDANGRATLYFLPLNYKIAVYDSTGTIITGYPHDNVAGSLWPGMIAANGTLAPAANANGLAHQFNATINKAGSGTHALFAGVSFGVPTIGAGAAVLTKSATVYIAGPPTVGTTVLALDVAAGFCKYEGQPAFLAIASTQSNVTGDATLYTVLFATEAFDQANNFASPTFTAPVAGKYTFSVAGNMSAMPAGASAINLYIVTTGRTYNTETKITVATISDTYPLSLSILADMAAGDTAQVKFQVSGGTKTATIQAGLCFSGVLTC